MFEVTSTGTITHHANAYPLPLRKPSQVGAWVRMCTLLGLTLCALFYVIGAHVQADAAQVEQVRQTCVAKADDIDTARFNPCATLDTTQVQDRRVDEYLCREVALEVYRTQDYTGTDTQAACLGAEDDWRVGLALDYGMTPLQYEQAEDGDTSAYLPIDTVQH